MSSRRLSSLRNRADRALPALGQVVGHFRVSLRAAQDEVNPCVTVPVADVIRGVRPAVVGHRRNQSLARCQAGPSGAARSLNGRCPITPSPDRRGKRRNSCYSGLFLVNRRPTAFHAPASTMNMTIQPFLRNASARAKRPSFCARLPAISPPMP